MLDIKWIRENPEKFDEAMTKRSNEFRALKLIELDEIKRTNATNIQELQAKRNAAAQAIAIAKRNSASVEGLNSLMKQAQEINSSLAKLESEGNESDHLTEILMNIPNIPHDSVPKGADENDNVEIEKFGKPRQFSFKPKSHEDLGEKLGMLDFEQSALMSGARFSTLSSGLARLERALSNFMLDIAGEFGYQEISPPNLVKSDAMRFAGQLPKFHEEAFVTKDDYWLIPTAEVSLVNLVTKKIIDEDSLPLRFTASTPCFRREAGSAGKDTRGMIRQHQFKKVELVSITTAQESDKEHDRMTGIACEILKRLELPYRKTLLCCGDMGFCAQKTYDLEVWMPSQEKYREISSCSNCGSFQARRGMIRYKSKNDGKNYLAHTLNGSALAIGRTIIAIMENYQNENGSIDIPPALINYMGGISKISC